MTQHTALAERVASDLKADMGAMAVLVTNIEPDDQRIVCNNGLPLPQDLAERKPLDYSICQHPVAMDFPLAADDILNLPLRGDQIAVRDLGLTSEIGAPYHDADGRPVGAICAVEWRRRAWNDNDVTTVTEAASRLDSLIEPSAQPRVAWGTGRSPFRSWRVIWSP